MLMIDGLSDNKGSVRAAIRAVELILLSAGFISTVLVFKGAVESSCSYDVVLQTLRKPWFYFRSWLSSPLYICIIMNLIVILIAASSLLHRHKMDNNDGDGVNAGGSENHDLQSSSPPPPRTLAATKQMQNIHLEDVKKATGLASPPPPPADVSVENHHYCDLWQDAEVQNCTFKAESLTETEEVEKAKFIDSSPKVVPTRRTAQQTTANKDEKQRRRQETENDEEDDTMEATWRAINGGPKQQTKQLKKSGTWPQPPRVYPSQELEESEQSAKNMKKSTTSFNDAVSIRCRGGLMRDPSMSLEEFNGKVEAFIKKFNNEMRLQRQESEQRYLEMINRSL